jgi:hypothetical protein
MVRAKTATESVFCAKVALMNHGLPFALARSAIEGGQELLLLGGSGYVHRTAENAWG